ncbi:MAG: hypothetical protein HQL14_05890 [Candidatus Omnitrophica bacterium]|nr:hypothetical protein [Candidatus Omnitrophota bacterium]
MKKKLLTAVVGIFVLGFASLAHADFIGNKDSKTFHTDTCPMVKLMKDANKVVFKTAADAIKAGYAPCKKCTPTDPAAVMVFVGNKSSMIYHKADCRLVASIKSDNIVKFATEADAKKAGYKPCSICFLKDKSKTTK